MLNVFFTGLRVNISDNGGFVVPNFRNPHGVCYIYYQGVFLNVRK